MFPSPKTAQFPDVGVLTSRPVFVRRFGCRYLNSIDKYPTRLFYVFTGAVVFINSNGARCKAE